MKNKNKNKHDQLVEALGIDTDVLQDKLREATLDGFGNKRGIVDAAIEVGKVATKEELLFSFIKGVSKISNLRDIISDGQSTPFNHGHEGRAESCGVDLNRLNEKHNEVPLSGEVNFSHLCEHFEENFSKRELAYMLTHEIQVQSEMSEDKDEIIKAFTNFGDFSKGLEDVEDNLSKEEKQDRVQEFFRERLGDGVDVRVMKIDLRGDKDKEE